MRTSWPRTFSPQWFLPDPNKHSSKVMVSLDRIQCKTSTVLTSRLLKTTSIITQAQRHCLHITILILITFILHLINSIPGVNHRPHRRIWVVTSLLKDKVRLPAYLLSNSFISNNFNITKDLTRIHTFMPRPPLIGRTITFIIIDTILNTKCIQTLNQNFKRNSLARGETKVVVKAKLISSQANSPHRRMYPTPPTFLNKHVCHIHPYLIQAIASLRLRVRLSKAP
mmetsp:Transcript_2810/g.4735  ORF Transcript_2810/g.4735 Transcript_2810/m.4735 type:complete len:226 (+) Transcript_2810:572-1249(+)